MKYLRSTTENIEPIDTIIVNDIHKINVGNALKFTKHMSCCLASFLAAELREVTFKGAGGVRGRFSLFYCFL